MPLVTVASSYDVVALPTVAIDEVPSPPGLVPRKTLYCVIGEPPLDAGAVQLRWTVPFPAVGTFRVGAPGGLAASAATSVERASPLPFTAATW